MWTKYLQINRVYEETNLLSPNSIRNYYIGDIAYNLLSDIVVGIPTLNLLEKTSCKCNKDIGYMNYWICLKDVKIRNEFAQILSDWIEKNYNKMTWIKSDFHNYSDIMDEIHPYANPANGYYIIDNK